CNLYSELCSRKFSNITTVVAHNSPFTRPHNALSNQDQPVITQLNDGIRGLEFATHLFLDELHLCHSDCLLLNAGPLEAYLRTVARWLLTHPDEVLTLILTNDDRVPPTAYTAPFNHSGLLPYIYVPHKPTMDLSDWPTLSEMIRRNQRVVVTLDYGANTTEVPWLLDEWSIRWQTPFSPADPSFPCTVHRPPSQPSSISRNRMYMANHNLNIPIFNFRAPLSASLTKHMATDSSILVPAYSLFEQVNAVDGNMSLGQAVQGCEKMWGRPPNGLLVDYYEAGGGSVFEVAAKANGLVYKKSCCGGGLRKAMMMEGGR
ncbi:PLC-like phosphodiesterase, partial [Delitschia confertaspora ATCC 74209]